MKNDINWHNFDSLPEQSLALAHRVADDIKHCLAHKSQMTLCVPGGNTPALFLSALGKIELEWHRVNIILNDERWVPLTDAKSNQAMLLRTLKNGHAKTAKVIAFYPSTESDEVERERFLKQFNPRHFPLTNKQALQDIKNRTPLSIDVCILGMGEDGHTASLFPNMSNLPQALNTDMPPSLISADPPEKEARVSLNLSALLSAQYHYLLITGDTKKSLIQKLQKTQAKSSPENLPIEHVIKQTSLAIYYSP